VGVRTVVVGMSGGTDSSVAAALLVEKGYRVCGITMRLWEDDIRFSEKSCCSPELAGAALSVCRKLGIPHYTIDVREEFRSSVVEYFAESYLSGITPNPCVICNRYIKWGKLIDIADMLGADYVATGHYARVRRDGPDGRFLLLRGIDRNRDQSYFLWALGQDQLSRTMFPVGGLTREEVGRIASGLGIRSLSRSGSQEICFIPDDDYRRFLEEKYGDRCLSPGEIRDLSGRVVGHHRGVAFYTVGQRRGLGLAFGRPVYVVDIDPESNVIWVGEGEELFRDSLVAGSTSWISVEGPEEGMRVRASLRYRHEGSDATIFPLTNDEVEVKFDEPQKAITPGQSVVFYDGDLVVGGGVILRRRGEGYGRKGRLERKQPQRK